jgi:phage shock protein C
MVVSNSSRSSETKRLFRPIKGRMIAGVSLGIGEYLNTDPVVIRLLFAFLSIFTGFFPGLVMYLVAWFLMPEAE